MMNRSNLVASLIVLVQGTAFTAEPVANEAEILAKIKADWTGRREQFQRVTYQLEGKVLRPRGGFNPFKPIMDFEQQGDLPPVDLEIKTSAHLEIDFENNRARFERSMDQFGPEPNVRLVSQTLVYDGERHTRYTPRGDNSWYRLDKIYMPEVENNERIVIDHFFDDSVSPIFFGHGFDRLPHAVTDLQSPVDCETCEIAGEANWLGRKCIVLHIKLKSGFWEYYVDVERDSAIVRATLNAGGKRMRIINVTYQETAVGWLPSKWTERQLNPLGKLMRSETLRVTDYQKNPELPPERFQIEPTPGVILWSKGKYVIFQGEGRPPVDVEEYRKNRI